MSVNLRLDPLFNSHMVLQRDRTVPVWGKGENGTQVVVRCGDVQVTALVEGEQWKVELPARSAGGPFDLTIDSNEEHIVLNDVLFGDVWLAGGQSNMEWRLIDTTDATAEIASAANSRLRFYNVPRVSYDDGAEHAGSWMQCSPEEVGEWSGVGYYFAQRLAASLEDVPIGIVGCNWGGTSASCWIPEEVLLSDPELRIYVDEFKQHMDKLDPHLAELEVQRYQAAVDEFNRRQSEGLEGTELGDYPWPPPLNLQSFLRPNGLYHTMILKTAPYAIKGFIYYQGESDEMRPVLYERLLGLLIQTWRKDWGDESLPFLFVQLPGHACMGGDADGEQWALLRESQWKVTQSVPHTALAVTIDCGERDDIHPRNKKPVGQRLALVALHNVYGHNVISSGPIVQDVRVKESRVELQFTHAEGLSAREGELVGFELAGENGQYVVATAVAHDNIVEVWNEQVAVPKAVRYAWANYPNANLINGAGLPAAPFRNNC
ncbi:MAG: sialate O-acetylesterase [Candidatus Cohnella colombiensis]|uniref:Sialate O-acetylesterase n=1 Tax=Candidatus Cohnella colombiensis TaxID=3121368 RepID=A0AA95JCA1_9BACL|nr:MAG: sialate O-acetylesterase [Cohnella sp.]